MVFGFFEGGITLTLNKTNFAFGETAEGKLALKLKKDKNARELRVRIMAVKKVTQYGTNSRGGMSRSNQDQVLFQNAVTIDGQKLYSPPGVDYDFKIQIPQQSALPQEIGGNLGTALKAVQFLGGRSSQVKWFIEATLDIPGGVDISKKVQISVQ
ncbi:MAG: hypothetical protein QGI60_02360 [archaeon]|jgi:hypothetical protein|nr:hypothetical protein [archaeon]